MSKKRSITIDSETLLCRLLAETDALWKPWRKPQATGYGRACELRWAYPTAGIPWRSHGVGGLARKTAERMLTGLAADGLVVASGAAGKTTTVRLTDSGEDKARQLCRLPSRTMALPLLAELLALREELGGMDRGQVGGWLPETLPARCEWDAEGVSDRLWDVEFHALPLLVGGLLESRPTSQGHIYYRVTAAGEKGAGRSTALTAGKAESRREWRCDRPTGEYIRDRQRYREILENKPAGQEIGSLALPVCGWTEDFAKRYRAKMAELTTALGADIGGDGKGGWRGGRRKENIATR